jgi:hypothetical protein
MTLLQARRNSYELVFLQVYSPNNGMDSLVVALISNASGTKSFAIQYAHVCLHEAGQYMHSVQHLMPAGVQPQERHGQPGGGAHQPGQRTAEGGARRTHRPREVLQALHRYVEGFHVGAAVRFMVIRSPAQEAQGQDSATGSTHVHRIALQFVHLACAYKNQILPSLEACSTCPDVSTMLNHAPFLCYSPSPLSAAAQRRPIRMRCCLRQCLRPSTPPWP